LQTEAEIPIEVDNEVGLAASLEPVVVTLVVEETSSVAEEVSPVVEGTLSVVAIEEPVVAGAIGGTVSVLVVSPSQPG
jgi:hypothetical protein